MARTVAEMAEMTQDQLFAGLYDALLKKDDLTAALIANAGVTDRPQLKINRLVAIPTAAVVDCTSTLTSQNISASPFTFDLKTFATQFDLCTIGGNLYSAFTDQLAAETEGAVRSVGEKIANDAIQGDGSSSIYGIEALTSAAGTISAGGSFGLDDVDALIDTVYTGGQKVLVGAPATIRAVNREIRAAGSGATMAEIAGRPVQAYNGLPLIKTEYADAGKLHCVDIEEGYKLFFGSVEMDPTINAGVFGFENVGSSQTKLAKLFRVYAHLAGVSFNSKGLAVLQGVV